MRAPWITKSLRHNVLAFSAVNGYCRDNSGNSRGFLYDGTTWTKLSYPEAKNTESTGVSGNNIVGTYYDDIGGVHHGYVYNGTTWTTLDYPGARYTHVSGIDGNTMVGFYTGNDTHGFLYNGSTWTTFDYPGAAGIQPADIDGNNVVGLYNDSSGIHSFLLPTPEPATLSLLALGGLALVRRKR